MSDFDRAVRKLGAWDMQDNLRKTNEKAERMVAGMRPGNNYFTPDQYRAVIAYMYPYEEALRDKYLKDGKFSPNSNNIKRIDVIKVPWLTEDRLVSLKDLSKLTGIPYKTLWAKVRKTKVPKKLVNRKKLYNIDHLRAALSDIPPDISSG